MEQTTKKMHEEIMRYKNHLVENTPDFSCYGPIVTHTEGMTDAERIKYMAAVFLREAEFAEMAAEKFAAENNLRWASHYLLEAGNYYHSYQVLLSVISRDWLGAAEIEEKMSLAGAKSILRLFPEIPVAEKKGI